MPVQHSFEILKHLWAPLFIRVQTELPSEGDLTLLMWAPLVIRIQTELSSEGQCNHGHNDNYFMCHVPCFKSCYPIIAIYNLA